MAEDEHDQSTWIGGLMDAAARGYQPDRERLRELVASRIAQDEEDRGLSGVRPRRRRIGGGPRTRLARMFSAGAGIAAVAGAVAIAVGVTTTLAVTSSGPAPRGSDVGVVGTGTEGTHGDAQAGATTVAPPNTGPVSSRASSAPPASSDAYVATGHVDQASNPNWAQLDVSVTAQKPLTTLEITIQVPACAGLSRTGLFDTGAYGAFTTSTATAPNGSVSYVFRLAAGHTLSPGTVEFAAQFNHGAAGWLPGADTYRVSAQAAGEPDAAVADGAY